MKRALGEFEQHLLFALVTLEDDADGTRVRDLVERETGRARSPGSIHTTFERLEARGFVVSHLGDPLPVRGGRRRRYYRITPAGARALKATWETLHQLAAGRLDRLGELAGEGQP